MPSRPQSSFALAASAGLGALVWLFVHPLDWYWSLGTALLAYTIGRALANRGQEAEDLEVRAREADRAVHRGELEALSRERDQLRSILDAMSEGVVLLDAEKRLQLTNPSARGLLQLPDAPSGSSAGPTILDANRSPLLLALANRGLSGERGAEEIALQNGRQILVRTAPLSSNEVKSAILVFNDVTDLRRLEAVRRDLVANVSHELRTPLTAIRGYAETLQNGGLQDQVHAAEFISIIHRHAERLSRLLDNLLELSRLEAGSRPLKREPVGLAPVIQRSLDAVRPKALTRQVELTVNVAAGPELLADGEALEQVLVNLLDNAVKYTPQAGNVRLTALPETDERGTRWHIKVTDDGIGIERVHLSRVFERFYRVDSGRSREMGGTGLGLAIVKHLTQAMGGKVGVESDPGRGSTFWLELPAA